jgi:hypothetical protein
MRAARYLTVMVGALALSASARAQVPMFMGNWNVGIDAGASVPTGGTANVYYAGWTAGAWLGYHSVGASVSVRGLYRYQHFVGSLSTTPNISMNGLSLEAVGHLPALYVKPYLLFGVGGYDRSDASAKLGWDVGGGVAFTMLSHTMLFEARYLDVVGGSNAFHTIPITLGLVF